jgi:hypothetical protein
MPGTYSPIQDPDDERTGLKSFDSDLDTDLDALDIDVDQTLSREQRRREWWRNAFINSLFIATWSVPTFHPINLSLTGSQVWVRDYSERI